MVVGSATGSASDTVLERLGALRQYQRNGKRSPHKPLLALGRLAQSGSGSLPWSAIEPVLACLIAEFGPPSRTGRAQSAACPFTRLRADGMCVLDQDVPMHLVRPLAERHVTGRFERSMEEALRADPALALSVARAAPAASPPDGPT